MLFISHLINCRGKVARHRSKSCSRDPRPPRSPRIQISTDWNLKPSLFRSQGTGKTQTVPLWVFGIKPVN